MAVVQDFYPAGRTRPEPGVHGFQVTDCNRCDPGLQLSPNLTPTTAPSIGDRSGCSPQQSV